MRSLILSTALLVALGAPAWAAKYPVSGRWGQSASTNQGAIDCTGKRVVTFKDNQRHDTGGGVPAFRNLSVTPAGLAQYHIVDEFTYGSVHAGRVYFTLVKTDADHITLQFQLGGTLTLQRCK